jgi:3-hydroxyacyl-CoA dehydrogenase
MNRDAVVIAGSGMMGSGIAAVSALLPVQSQTLLYCRENEILRNRRRPSSQNIRTAMWMAVILICCF